VGSRLGECDIVVGAPSGVEDILGVSECDVVALGEGILGSEISLKTRSAGSES